MLWRECILKFKYDSWYLSVFRFTETVWDIWYCVEPSWYRIGFMKGVIMFLKVTEKYGIPSPWLWFQLGVICETAWIITFAGCSCPVYQWLVMHVITFCFCIISASYLLVSAAFCMLSLRFSRLWLGNTIWSLFWLFWILHLNLLNGNYTSW